MFFGGLVPSLLGSREIGAVLAGSGQACPGRRRMAEAHPGSAEWQRKVEGIWRFFPGGRAMGSWAEVHDPRIVEWVDPPEVGLDLSADPWGSRFLEGGVRDGPFGPLPPSGSVKRTEGSAAGAGREPCMRTFGGEGEGRDASRREGGWVRKERAFPAGGRASDPARPRCRRGQGPDRRPGWARLFPGKKVEMDRAPPREWGGSGTRLSRSAKPDGRESGSVAGERLRELRRRRSGSGRGRWRKSGPRCGNGPAWWGGRGTPSRLPR